MSGNFRGACVAEIIPYEPDADNAAEGKSSEILSRTAIPDVFLNLKGMEITFNNRSQQIREQSSIQIILNDLVGEKLKGIAVAVNETVIAKTRWDSYVLEPGDKVLVIKATQGG